ncbi:MAG: DoxX family protein [Chloroflexi bacterium]|nr:DoxX family protein [Chloroflexota bacterium]
MRLGEPLDARWGIAIIRLLMGVILIGAGLEKWFGGITGFVGFVGQLGIPGSSVVGPIIAAAEVIGGVLILLGVQARYVAIWFVAEFLVTSFYVKLGHNLGFDAARIDLMMLAGSIVLVLCGAGKLAYDEWRETSRPSMEVAPSR